MCLAGIEKRGLKLAGVGWKVFEIMGGNYRAHRIRRAAAGQKLQPVYYNGRGELVRVGRWLQAKREQIFACSYAIPYTNFCYYSGFHIFLDKPDINSVLNHTCGGNVVVRKVKFRRGRIIGHQQRNAIIVADEMIVLPVRKNKKKT